MSVVDYVPPDLDPKRDLDKPRFDYIPPKAHLELAKVMTFGAKKYAPHSYGPVPVERWLAAAMRHINAYQRGEIMDPESGFPHLAHAAASCMIAVEVMP